MSRFSLIATYAIIVLITALGSLSQTAVNSMLVSIDETFAIASTTGQWLTTIYMLVMGISVPIVPYLSKKYCTKTLTVIAMALFLAGCFVDGLATSFALEFIGRVLQAISAGITLPLVQAFGIRFPAGQRGFAMGVAGIAMGFAPNIGPVLGGLFVATVGWRYLFIVLAALCVLLLAATFLLVPKEELGESSAAMDYASLVLSTLGFGGLLLGVSNASSLGFASPLLWTPIVIGALFILLFIKRQLKLETPFINLGIFKHKVYTGTFFVHCALMTSYMGITLVVPLYIQDLWGGTALQAGQIFLPATVIALFANPLAGLVSDKIGVRPVALTGGILMTIGAVGMCFVSESTPFVYLLVFQAIRGSGMSCLMGPTMSLAFGELRSLTMDGSSFLVLVRQACASIGTAAMVLLIAQLNVLAAQGTIPASLPYQAAFIFSAVFSALMLAGVWIWIRDN